MLRSLIAAAVCVIAASPAIAQSEMTANIYFERGRDQLLSSARQTLDALVAQMGKSDEPILLSGHTSRFGEESDNVGLSQRRANAVRDYLVGRGVPAARITTAAYGETRPARPTADGVTEPLNERVEVRVGAQPPAITAADVLTLSAGFQPDPVTIPVTAGGLIAFNGLDTDCYGGHIPLQAQVVLRYEPGDYPLIVRANADQDATLTIVAPDGGLHCNDDGPSGFDPEVRFDFPLAGLYQIHVGTFSEGERFPATVSITEVD
ncbi:hypothetical protein IP78_10185 [Brevundimonas sp. AAP58]|uniref:OmpA family protein n=1 Tax=Brevundimonas sp. AAP58 TaxID=1523422 RepID=UPI0006B8F76E|nr:OmpA family protein [Brevundimonas sp. AAP58]KPF78876.1 hypothetical protein IP78_10185 [Brevundimonas sp. AAP58]